VLRYNGNNVEDDCVSYQEDDDDLVPTSLDNDFQLSELCRFQNNTHCAFNDDTLRLQHQLENHSPAKVRLPSEMQVRESRKNMLECIDYIISNGDISENPEIAEIWDDLERVIQEKQVLVRNIVLSSTAAKPVGKEVVWPALTSSKTKVMKRYKGITG
jgi:hypothetical protein